MMPKMRRTALFASWLFFAGSLDSAIASNEPTSTVDLELKSAPMRDVLQLLAARAGLDMVLDQNLEGEVSLSLSNVPVMVAFDAVLQSHGLDYTREGRVIVVRPRKELLPGDTASRVFALSYADAEAVADAVKSMLSELGKVHVLREGPPGKGATSGIPSRTLVITDTPRILARVSEVVDELDAPRRQIEIEVRFVETTVDTGHDLGLDWANAFSFAMGDSARAASIMKTISPSSGFSFGTLSVNEVRGTLDFLSTVGDANLLSHPRVLVSDNTQARISSGTTIPIATINRFSGTGGESQDIVTFQDRDVAIELIVTPRINEDDQVTVKVHPRVEEITGWTGPAEQQQPITSKREVETELTVASGETITMGGLVKENEIEKVKKTWLLGDIPIIGRLFRHSSLQRTKTNLVIFITPRVIEEAS